MYKQTNDKKENTKSSSKKQSRISQIIWGSFFLALSIILTLVMLNRNEYEATILSLLTTIAIGIAIILIYRDYKKIPKAP